MILLNELQGNIVLSTKQLSGSITTAKMEIGGDIIYNGYMGDIPVYVGPYEVTPTQEEQVLQTDNRLMTENLIVNPIPENYGLITWNGSHLRIS